MGDPDSDHPLTINPVVSQSEHDLKSAHSADGQPSTISPWIVPRPHIFGSDELSKLAPGIAGLIPKAEISIHPDLAEKLGVTDGQLLEFSVDGETKRLPVRLDGYLPVDVAVVPTNFDETAGIFAPTKLTLERAK